MSCRKASATELGLARPVAWKRLGETNGGDGGGSAPLAELEMALEQCRLSQERLVELERSLEPMKKDAFERGYRAAHAEAQQTAQRIVETETARFHDALRYMAGLRAAWRAEIEKEAVELAFAVARRVLNRELATDPAAVRAIIRVALEKIQSQQLQRVRVWPAAEAVVRGWLEAEAPAVEVIADAALPAGGVRFELVHGAVDASVDAQLQEIERGLTDRCT